MLKRMKRFLRHSVTILSLFLAVSVPATAAEQRTLRIGWTSWSDAEAITNIAKLILERRLGYKVAMVNTDIANQYRGVAKGGLDVMLMAWLPGTHKQYWEQYHDEVVDLGVLYDGCKLGWAVPDYIPARHVDSLDDLNKPAVRQMFKGRIHGIDSGAGLTRLSRQAILDYRLAGYQLDTPGEAGMVVALDRAVKYQLPIVVTTWTPHWMFPRYKMRYLRDPKQSLGDAEAVHAVASKSFERDFPKAAAFIRNFKVPVADLEQIMLKAKDSPRSPAGFILTYEQEAENYIKANPALVAKWLRDVR